MSSDATDDNAITRGRFGNAIRWREGVGVRSIPSMGEIGLNQFAPYLMNRVSGRWNANMAEALKPHDLTIAKMRTMAVLSISPGLTINELSELTVTEQSTMSRTLDSMEEQGLIRRVAREDDLRVREVHLTEAGREAFARFWPTMYEAYADLFQGVSEEEYEVLVTTLHKLIRNLRRTEP